jgi:hypothetical protein
MTRPGGFRGLRSTGLLLSLVLGLLTFSSCSSPNRGSWAGTFDGDVSGTVEFRINARGTKVRGTMDGTTAQGEPFKASLEGILREDFLALDFEGAAAADQRLPLAFDGEMTGSLIEGRGTGDWLAKIRLAGMGLNGTWQVEQVPSE